MADNTVEIHHGAVRIARCNQPQLPKALPPTTRCRDMKTGVRQHKCAAIMGDLRFEMQDGMDLAARKEMYEDLVLGWSKHLDKFSSVAFGFKHLYLETTSF